MIREAPLSDCVIEIAEDYLGPSAPRFMERLARNHLGNSLDQITADDMQQLIQWTRISAAMLTDDADLVAEFVGRLSDLTEPTAA